MEYNRKQAEIEAKKYLDKYYAKCNPKPDPIPLDPTIEAVYSKFDKIIKDYPYYFKDLTDFRTLDTLKYKEKSDMGYKKTHQEVIYLDFIKTFIKSLSEDLDKKYIENYVSLIDEYFHNPGYRIKK